MRLQFLFFSSEIKLVDASFNCRNIKNAFYFTKKAPFVLEIFKFLHFPFPFVFPFLAIAADFIEILSKRLTDDKSYSLWHHHVPKLDFKNANYLISGYLKAWSWYFIRWNILYKELFHGKIYRNSRPLFTIFNHLFGCPNTKLGPLNLQGNNITHYMLITAPYLV